MVASVHDVAADRLDRAQVLRERLARWGVVRATLLVVPDFHGAAPLGASLPARRWLRERAAAGDEICLHGWSHRAERPARGWARARAALFTAGEGECLGWDAALAARRLGDGRKLLEDVSGVAVRGFVAPAWLEPPGCARWLAAAGFEWHETRWRLTTTDGAAVVRGPVLGFATRTWARRWAALAWVAALTEPVAVAARLAAGAVRVALHPDDLGHARVMAAAERAVRRALIYNPPMRSAEALGLEPPVPPARAVMMQEAA